LIHFASQKTSSAFRNTEVTCSPEKNSQLPQDSEGEEEEDLSPTHQVLEDVKAVESRGAPTGIPWLILRCHQTTGIVLVEVTSKEQKQQV